MTGASDPGPGQNEWPRWSQCPVSWLTTMVRYQSSGPGQKGDPIRKRSSLITTYRPAWQL